MVLLITRRLAIRRRSIALDPFSYLFATDRFVCLLVVTSEDVDFEVGSLA